MSGNRDNSYLPKGRVWGLVFSAVILKKIRKLKYFMKDMVLDTGEIIYEGRLYPGPRNLVHQNLNFDADKWFVFWKSKADEIKKSKLSFSQIRGIHREYVHHVFTYAYNKAMLNKHQDLNQLSAELEIAFEIAYSNYRDSHGKLWGFIAGFFARQLGDMPRVKDKSSC